jgi:hypothetical protein
MTLLHSSCSQSNNQILFLLLAAGVLAEAERLAESCSRELRLRAAKAAREAG